MAVLDASRLIVLGESLAAGLVNFGVHADDQARAFPQLVARQLGVDLPGPLFRAPGIGEAAGFAKVPVYSLALDATEILVEQPIGDAWRNLSIPGLTLDESIGRRPVAPLVHHDDARQTALNFVLGAAALTADHSGSLRTPLEQALALKPTLAIVELGFADVIEAAVSGSTGALPADDRFRDCYARVVTSLRDGGADLVVTTIPDPMDTAHFSTLDAASRVLKMPVASLIADYGLQADDRIRVSGLTQIALQIMRKRVAPLPAGSTLDGRTAAAITARVQALNRFIAAIAREQGAAVADFAALYRTVRAEGLRLGARTLSADFLGGFYSLNGYTPGATGQAALANAVVDAIALASGRRIAPIDLAAVMAGDAVADYRQPAGPDFRTWPGRAAAARATLQLVMFLVGFVANAIAGSIRRKKTPRPPEQGNDASRWTLKLPRNLTQVLPIDTRASYYGDALRPVHSTVASEVSLGLTGKLLFRGMALLDSHLHGKVKIAFSPPVNNITHFEVTHPGGLSGDDGLLSAPVFFALAAVQHKVMDSTAEVSSGDLNLITGEVTNLRYTLYFLNSAILALAAVNPALPKNALAFPGEHGSTWARFDQRADGLLDYTCYGTSFVPLSVLKTAIRFPLAFSGPSGSVASIPGDGTALHPHFRISTKPLAPRAGAPIPALRANTIRDVEIAGARWQLQFGEDFGGTVSIAMQPVPPAGASSVAAPTSVDPSADDRLNWPVGAIDLKTGTVMPGGGSRLPPLDLSAL